MLVLPCHLGRKIAIKIREGHPGTRPKSPAVGPSVAPPEMFACVQPLLQVVVCSVGRLRYVLQHKSGRQRWLPCHDELVPSACAPRHTPPNKALSALPLPEAGVMPRFGCDELAATARVPLQTPHKSILRVSTARHCLRFAFGVKHIFYDYIL